MAGSAFYEISQVVDDEYHGHIALMKQIYLPNTVDSNFAKNVDRFF